MANRFHDKIQLKFFYFLFKNLINIQNQFCLIDIFAKFSLSLFTLEQFSNFSPLQKKIFSSLLLLLLDFSFYFFAFFWHRKALFVKFNMSLGGINYTAKYLFTGASSSFLIRVYEDAQKHQSGRWKVKEQGVEG